MGRTDQRELGAPSRVDPAYAGDPGAAPGLPGPARGAGGPKARRQLSSGHVVMILAGVVAAVLTFAVLSQAGGPGTVVLVASQPLAPGEVAEPSMFSTTTLKAASGVAGSLLTPAQEGSLIGKSVAVLVRKGQLIEGNQFSTPSALPPRMTILVDPSQVPGGTGAIQVGSRIDLLSEVNSLPVSVPGLIVVSPPTPEAGTLAGSPASVAIEVYVPTTAMAESVFMATAQKFSIRLSDPSPAASPPAGVG